MKIALQRKAVGDSNMMNSSDVTVTDARMKSVLRKHVAPIINDTVPQIVSEAVNENKIHTGKLTKFYPYLDKAEVRFTGSKKTVLCKILHLYSGSLIDLFTPEGERSFCKKLKEPCIIPHSPLYCLVVDINDKTKEQLLLGYYHSTEFTGFKPAPTGGMKIISFGGYKQNYIEFNGSKLIIRTSKDIHMEKGEYTGTDEKVERVNTGDVYTKEEVYTKQEVDELIAAKIAEALTNNDENNIGG